MKIRERNFALTFRTTHADGRIEGGQCHAHIARMSGNALLALAKDRVNPIVTVKCAAAAARISLIARWKCRIIEIIAAGSLEKIAANGGHVCAIADSHRTTTLHSKP